MPIWKSPFNQVVRSNEAGIVGLLAGMMIGVAAMLFVPIIVRSPHLEELSNYCQETGISEVAFTYTGEIKKVTCLSEVEG